MSDPNPTPVERRAIPRADGLVMHPRALWSFAHIALYSSYEYNYVVNVLSVMEDFPKPIRIMGKAGKPRFKAGEIMRWFEEHQV